MFVCRRGSLSLLLSLSRVVPTDLMDGVFVLVAD
jgi:hypothetical protein